jgi:polysaccharide export outer membrane protein
MTAPASPTPGGLERPAATSTAAPGAGQEQLPPGTGEPEVTGTERASALPAPDELSPIERLLAGSVPDAASTLRQFGYDLFTRVPTTFAPVTDVPVGPDYVIGPGDNLNILLWGGVQEGYQVEVNRNGTIALPRLGAVQVWGLTLDQVQRLLQQRFGEFYPDFRMAVTLGRLRTILVYVVGEVRQPGAYTVSALSTMINALFASGGPTKSGSLRRIQLVRAGRQIHTLDLYDFLIQGDKSQDQSLQSGDTILVPLIGSVAGVAGNVKRPGIYEISPGTSLRQLLDLAGDVTPLGYLQRVQVERIVANEKKVVVDVDLLQSRRKSTPATLWQTRIADGDLVRIFAIITKPENVVLLDGHVVRPGRYELKAGMRLRDLLPAYTALLPEPYLDYGEIVRYVEPDLRRIVVPFNVRALLAGDPAHNLILQPLDNVRVFPKTQFADPPTVTVEGEVRAPGTFPLLGAMRVRDLVARAGWLTNMAYMERAEVLRITADRDLRALPFNLRAALQGQEQDNLLLQNEDRVIIHNLFEQKFPQNVRVVGLVNKPGEYPLTEGMRVSDLIFRAGSVQKLAYLEKAELTRHRIGQSGDAAMRVEINLAQALAGDTEHNLFLEDFDQLLIRPIPDIELDRTVEFLGEVRFPGAYPVQKGERLSSVLRRAGGFTPNAYPRGAVLTRARAKAEQERRLQELIREEEISLLTQGAAETQAALTPEEIKGQQQAVEFRRELVNRLKGVQPDGRIVIRLRPIEEFAGTADDIELESGDRLAIPQVPQYVTVLGEVYNRTSLLYEPGKTVAHYLAKVGGIKPTANEDEIYLVQIDGTVISNTQNQFAIVLVNGQTKRFKDFFTVQPQPGDSIIVPRRTITPNTLRNTRDIVQIIFQGISSLGIIAALLVNL